MTHVTVGARTSDPLHRRRALYLKSYLDSLLLAIRNFYLGRQAGRHTLFLLLLKFFKFVLLLTFLVHFLNRYFLTYLREILRFLIPFFFALANRTKNGSTNQKAYFVNVP